MQRSSTNVPRIVCTESQLFADQCSSANCLKSCHCFTTAHHFRTVASMVFLLTFRSVFLLHARSTQKRSFVEMSPLCLERHNVNDDVFICLRATFAVEKKIRFVGDGRPSVSFKIHLFLSSHLFVSSNTEAKVNFVLFCLTFPYDKNCKLNFLRFPSLLLRLR